MTTKDEIVKSYFDAWDQRDTNAIMATFAKGGTYTDPATQAPLEGQAIADYAQSLFDAFPNMSVELISQASASTGVVAAAWLIFGTHEGPLMGKPPTGKSMVLQGCDFLRVEDGLLTSVVGLWDRDDLLAQLGL